MPDDKGIRVMPQFFPELAAQAVLGFPSGYSRILLAWRLLWVQVSGVGTGGQRGHLTPTFHRNGSKR